MSVIPVQVKSQNHEVLEEDFDKLQERNAILLDALTGLRNEYSKTIPLMHSQLELLGQQVTQYESSLADLDRTLRALGEGKRVVSDSIEKNEAGSSGSLFHSIFHVLWEKIRDSSLYSLWVGVDVTVEEVDEVINALVLVNALIVTIPFGVMPNVGFEYWDDISNILSDSKCEDVYEVKDVFHYYVRTVCCMYIYRHPFCSL